MVAEDMLINGVSETTESASEDVPTNGGRGGGRGGRGARGGRGRGRRGRGAFLERQNARAVCDDAQEAEVATATNRRCRAAALGNGAGLRCRRSRDDPQRLRIACAGSGHTLGYIVGYVTS